MNFIKFRNQYKIIAVTLIISLMITNQIMTFASGDITLKLTSDNNSLSAGQTFNLNVELYNITRNNIASIKIKLNFDSDVVELTNIDESIFSDKFKVDNSLNYTQEISGIKLLSIPGIPVQANEGEKITVATIPFKIKDALEIGSTINISSNTADLEVCYNIGNVICDYTNIQESNFSEISRPITPKVEILSNASLTMNNNIEGELKFSIKRKDIYTSIGAPITVIASVYDSNKRFIKLFTYKLENTDGRIYDFAETITFNKIVTNGWTAKIMTISNDVNIEPLGVSNVISIIPTTSTW